MTIKYDVPGIQRKNLAEEIAKWMNMNVNVNYLGAPSFAYEIGGCRIDPDGSLTINIESDNIFVKQLLAHLEDEGYKRIEEKPQGGEICDLEGESKKNTEEAIIAAQSESVGLVVAMPRGTFTDDAVQNLKRLIDAKGNLIKKALAVDNLPIEVDEEKISFPWFSEVQDGETASAYTHFITALCDMAKNQSRITAKEKSPLNEKYAFRCFLLRLGFIGSEYKKERKILLRNLSGSSAFKNVANKEV